MKQSAINVTPGGDPRISEQLRDVLRCDRRLPAFRRGQMYFDFKAGKIRIAPAPGSDA